MSHAIGNVAGGGQVSDVQVSKKKRTPGTRLDIEDDRLNRRKIRANLGEEGEKDWTNSPHDTADQFSSSKGYVRGGVGIIASWQLHSFL